ncbi:MAG: TetR/AcrR family transcriptional regulator, partial [Leptospiraceae bacterium]|nr:TetR/AcrR family transcriptional regulator [Leptospiraceae bacterium]
NGYQNTTISMIMKDVQMSIGTFYIYFNNKIEIYKFLMDEGIQILQQKFEDAVSWPDMTAKEKLEQITRAYYQFYSEHPKYFEIIAFVTLTEEELRERESPISHTIDERNLKILTIVRDILEEGNQSGEFQVKDPWITANILWGWLDGMFALERRNNLHTTKLSLRDLIQQSLHLILSGIENKS